MAQLFDFLVEAELQQYYTHLTTKLNVTGVSQIKHLTDEQFAEIGMTKPEIRRLKRFLKKHGQQGPLNKLKRILTKGQEDLRSSTVEGSPSSSSGSSLDVSNIQGMTIFIDQSTVTLSCELGSGEFGNVHYGLWRTADSGKIQVAVKTLKKSVMKDNSEKFLEELFKMKHLDHIHIVKLYGAILDQESLMVVTEFAPMKSLADCLRDPGNKAYFPVSVLCELAIQIADGMSYLESRNFVHRDLAARNVLVFSKDMVKICDQGLTRALGIGLDYYQQNVSINIKIPIAWCAPECITEGHFSSASDVWSYGVTLWELFSYGFQPWAGFTGSQIALAIGASEGQRLDQPERCPQNFYELMLLCWHHNPKDRPSFAQLMEKTRLMKATRHIVTRITTMNRSDCLSYCVGDIITLLDDSCSVSGLWKGIHESKNKVGLYSSMDILPYVESKTSEDIVRKGKVNRKASDRKSLRPGQRLHAGMISGPQNDLRHMGHVGHDGVTFGELMCLPQSHDGLPNKTMHSGDDFSGSSISLPASVHSAAITKSCSNTSLVSNGTSVVTSIISSDTLTDVSSMQDFDSLPKSVSEEALSSFGIDSPMEDLDSFQIPDISNTFDLGPSIFDEVMKVFGGSKDENSSTKERTKTKGEDEANNDRVGKYFDKHVERDKRGTPVKQVLPPPTAHSSYQNGCGSLNMDNFISSIPSEERKKQNTTEVLVLKGPVVAEDKAEDSVRKKEPLLRHSLQESSLEKSNFADGYSNRMATGRAKRGSRGEINAHFSGGTSNQNDTLSSLKNGMLSKIGSALNRKSNSRDQKMLHSLDLHSSQPPSISSSSEFLPDVRKLSSTSSSSLPVHRGGLTSHMSSCGLNTDEEETSSNLIRRLRAVHSFSKTKEKIRSSVVNVMQRRSSLKTAQLPPMSNLNANTLFFDRLREQEIENVQLDQQNSVPNDDSNKTEEKCSNISSHILEEQNSTTAEHMPMNSFIEPTSILHQSIQPSSASSSGASLHTSEFRKQGIGSTHDSLVAGRCPSVISRDSLRMSECSSLTQQSVDSANTDDSGTTSLDGCTVPVSSSFDSDCHGSHFHDFSVSEPVECGEICLPSQIKIKSSPISELNASSDSPTSRMFDCLRSREDEEVAKKVELVSSLAGVHIEDCMYALSDSDWDVNSAIQRLKLRQHVDSDLNNYEHYKKTFVSNDWNCDSSFNRISEHPPSGRESPELVHV